MATLECDFCGTDEVENYKIHSCFSIICFECSSVGSCKKCNYSFENCLDINAKKCVYYNICKSLAVCHCNCKSQLLCDFHYHRTHYGSVACTKDLITDYVPDKCDKCKRFIVSYIGQMKICTGCWMDIPDDQQHNYIDAEGDAMKRIDQALEQNAQKSMDNQNTMMRYNIRQFEIIVNKIKKYQQEFIAKCNENFNATSRRINVDATTIPTGVKYLKFAVVNKQVDLESVLFKIDEWQKTNGSVFNFPVIKFKENADTNGFFKLEVSVDIVNVNNTFFIDNSETGIQSNASTPITSPTPSISMSIGSSESSVVSSPVHCSKQPLQMLPVEEQDWVKTKLTFFRDPFWIYVVNPEYMASRDGTLAILANDPILVQASKICRGEQYIVQDFYQKQRYLKRAICLGNRTNKFNNVYVQFLDYGNKCWVAENDIFDIPQNIHEIDCTVKLVKMAGIAPVSNFCFLKAEQEAMKEFISKNLVLLEKVVAIKPIAKTQQEGTFCQFKVKIDGVDKDLTEMLIALGFGTKVKNDCICFVPTKDYCYTFHFDYKKNKICKCTKDHTCSYCGQRHSVGGCQILKDRMKKAKF